ncbi:MerR family transcriptional regulator [Metabacillus fastidiosus]|uniref:MerR family transcriptional regulator n=1 Tax=Metabacillus fastidiosus TaxID=1458 RepID=UPI003D2D7423
MYKIGELARKAEVSKRTIDYYTKIGLLLVAETSASNYRLYSEEAFKDIQFIEKCKKLNMCLVDIKERLELRRREDAMTNEEEICFKQAELLRKHMERLEVEIKDLKPIFEQLNEHSKLEISKQISPQSMALIQSLMILIN